MKHRLTLISSVLAVTAMTVFVSSLLGTKPGPGVGGKQTVVTFKQGSLSVNIPYAKLKPGAGELTQGARLLGFEEGCFGNLGHHAGHHHGAASTASIDR